MKTKKATSQGLTPIPKMGEVIQSRRDGQQRFDGWQNLVTLMGTSADKRTHSFATWDQRPPEFYEQLYSSGGIPARIVDLIPDECMRNGWDWLETTPAKKKELNERCKELNVRGAFLNAWKWGRAYGGGLLHIVTDTDDPSQPLQKGEKVIGLRDLSRWDVRILTTDVEFDFGSPNFGHPRIYYLNVQMGAQYKGYPIHWTRMIRFDGQLVPRRTFIRNNYWHDSVLNRMYNSIRNYETSNDAAAHCLQDFSVDVYKLQNVAAMIGAGHEQKVKDRIEMMAYTKSVINAMILDTKDEEYENKGRSLEGVAELLVHQANRLVAETDIPHTKLLGESPDGSNATGNSTSQQWYNFLSSEQENNARPKLEHLLEVIFQEENAFKWKPLRVLDDKETADLRKTNAETDQIYLQAQVLDPTEVTESRFGGEEYSAETKLDKDARASGEISPGSNDDLGGYDDDDGSSNNGEDNGGNAQEGKGEKSKGESTTGNKPPEGGDEIGKKQKPGSKKADLNGKKKEALDAEEVSVTSENPGMGQSEFEPRNEVLEVKGKQPLKPIVSQTESLPFRDPDTDPPMKGPGIPNKARTYLPTRGNGITANSGFDFIKDANQKGSSFEITQTEPRKTEDSFNESDHPRAEDGKFGAGGGDSPKPKPKGKGGNGKKPDPKGKKKKKQSESSGGGGGGSGGSGLGSLAEAAEAIEKSQKEDSEQEPTNKAKRAATIIVRRGDDILMGKRRDNGRWTLPGGHIEDNESHHQGAVRELMEETGLEAKKLKFIGGRVVEPKQGQSVQLNIYQHHADPKARPTNKIDPDKEIQSFRWVSMKEPLDEEIAGNLQHPGNAALQHLGLIK